MSDLADRLALIPNQLTATDVLGTDVYAQVIRPYRTQYVARILNDAAGYRAGNIAAFDTANTRLVDTEEIVAQGLETLRAFRQAPFFPTATEIECLPGLDIAETYADDPGAIPIIAHYSGGPWSVWIAGYGKGDDLGLAYGYGTVHAAQGRWGEVELPELEQILFHGRGPAGMYLPAWMERDHRWETKPASAILASHLPGQR